MKLQPRCLHGPEQFRPTWTGRFERGYAWTQTTLKSWIMRNHRSPRFDRNRTTLSYGKHLLFRPTERWSRSGCCRVQSRTRLSSGHGDTSPTCHRLPLIHPYQPRRPARRRAASCVKARLITGRWRHGVRHDVLRYLVRSCSTSSRMAKCLPNGVAWANARTANGFRSISAQVEN